VLARGRGFAVPLPEGWQDRTVLTLVEPAPGAEGSASIVVTRDQLPPGTSPDAYAGMHEAVLRAEAGSRLERLECDQVSVAGRPATVRSYRWALGEEVLRQRIWCIAADGVGLCITASAPEARFEQLAPAFATAVDGFRLE
jgi:hypothetical protein